MLYLNSNNKKLKKVFELYNERFCYDLPQEKELANISFTSIFENKMQKLLKKQKKPYYYMINTVGKKTAIIILAFIVSITATTFSVEALRKAVIDLITNEPETDMVIGNSSKQNTASEYIENEITSSAHQNETDEDTSSINSKDNQSNSNTANSKPSDKLSGNTSYIDSTIENNDTTNLGSISKESGVYKYSISNGEAIIIDFIQGNSSEITIPSYLDGYPVTKIQDEAFLASLLTSITIPDTVKSIGNYAFYGSNSLKKIYIPKSVTKIGDFAFASCNLLNSINVDDENSKYHSIDGVLYSKDKKTLLCCPSWKKQTLFTIPNNVVEIYDSAFCGCRLIKNITIPDTVTTIGNKAFYKCYGLTTISMGKNVKTIGDSAFAGCTSLKNINLPDSIINIGAHAFEESGVKNIVLPTGITKINNHTFSKCKSLEKIIIPQSVEVIGEKAFFYCFALKMIQIPEGVKEIQSWVFRDCKSLETVILPLSLETLYCSAFYDLFNTRLYYPGSAEDWKLNITEKLSHQMYHSIIVYNSTGPETS